ncbi:hypothetical protein GGI13_004066 [Coemansia sp. RSA 455]|nr:hypothetical protein LPJ71_003583 [Coemansia sp. S17]KAJ2019302.1 hypothetical protein GGI14_001703 [Coemansia sp. S680]KAJ2036740.1 hypothetical protein H4S03_003436 [Coemansia sp. S3946]KAJ2056376.1 hypothetical protein GGH13_007572 [Coemansia sp. S155-1]KAJ2250227.1 hypothetical protein GGI13_004066 [Coemansia sp. RSA 455]KAJ2344733.1 hypothetical protein GGH92_004360 [Coemansia sp. RSA 2673]KAJ2458553.1 hypothetical protein GGI03_005788 [Coemansia sp. RSA 2337]
MAQVLTLPFCCIVLGVFLCRSVGKEFLCKVRYHNPLPEVPFPPKLLPIPPTYVDPNAGSYSQARLHHYVEYRHTTLEEATPYHMFVDADYGMPIDPCLLGAFDEERGATGPKPQVLDEKDQFLLNLPTASKASNGTIGATGINGGSGPQTPASSALPQAGGAPETMATTGPGQHSGVRKSGLQRVSSNLKRKFDHSLEGQLQAIDESFKYYAKYSDQADGEQELLRDLRHPTNSSLRAVEAVPIFPDEDLWSNTYSVYSFDAAPEPEYTLSKRNKLGAEELRALENGARESMVFRPRTERNAFGEDDKWIECFLPASEDTARRVRRRLEDAEPVGRGDEGVEYRFEKSRDYNIIPITTQRQDLYMLTYKPATDSSTPSARYVPIKQRVMLKRRQILPSARQLDLFDDPQHVTNLDLQLRDFSEEELQDRLAASNALHEVIREEIIRVASARADDDSKEDIDIDDEIFPDDNRRRRTLSYSSSPTD